MENKLINLAKEARYKPSILLAIVLAFVFVIVGGIPSIFVSFDNEVMNQVIGNLILSFAGASILCFAYVRFVEKRSIVTMGFATKGALYKYVKGLAIGFMMFSFVYIIAVSTGSIEASWGIHSANIITIGFILLGFIVQGATEEIIFRGWMLPVLGARYNTGVAVIISSLAFTLLHGMNPGLTILISGPVEGRELLSGRLFGMEGSLICTLVLCGCSIYLLKKLRGKDD